MGTATVSSDTSLHHSPLHALHQSMGARMMRFASYELPVQYPSGLLAEHHHTREKVSLFDVSHMGQISVSGPNAAQALELVLPIDVLHLGENRQRYALLLNTYGGILDDLMVINRGHDYLLIVNAACKHQDIAWLSRHIGHLCKVQALPEQALLAIQGPQADEVIFPLLPATHSLLFMQGMPFEIDGIRGYLTRSGYSGEDGFELSVPAVHAQALAKILLDAPAVRPAGLGARNSLRLEAGLCLYGTDMDYRTTPTQASLDWSISPARRAGGDRAGGFLGADVVLHQMPAKEGVEMVRVGLHALERVPVRDGTALYLPEGARVGHVTSGLLSPTLDRPIAMGYLPPGYARPGTRIDALVRGRPVPMEVIPLPFIGTRYRKN